jgi:SPP1 gp7 family putative phage head morphogenesis protein
MYEKLDSLLEKAKKKIRTEFNRLGMMGFDELNVTNTTKTTKAMFDRLLSNNEKLYLAAAKDSYTNATKAAKGAGFSGEESEIDADWLMTILLAYNLVTGYLYNREAERKRLRLNEQILTAREYDDRQMYNRDLQKSANLWWTQTSQYGIDVVDSAALQAYEDMGVERVRWVAELDSRTCNVCRSRNGVVYDIAKVPKKTHYNCRCYLEPVDIEE